MLDTAKGQPHFFQRTDLPVDLKTIIKRAPNIIIPKNRQSLIDLALGGPESSEYEVGYDVPGKGWTVEARVVRCRNGLSVNYDDAYMRRRDPDCMVIADDAPSDKPRYSDRFGEPFESLRSQIIDWLGNQELIVLPFIAGHSDLGFDALLVAPSNTGFFAAALADLQGKLPSDTIPNDFFPRAIIYLAPPFRHTHCDGKQVVIHNREKDLHEVFALNLYPGPSAKKGIYGVLLTMGESEGWLTAHGSTVEIVTPYDNVITIMHEGASGSGKSEMLEHAHREDDGRLLLGKNIVTDEKRYLTLNQSCDLNPVTDDMALCHPSLHKSNKLTVVDAEDSWFLRINHIDHYGVDPIYERLCVHPPEPLIFLNLYGSPGSTCLIWEHTEDEPGKRCPNPRVIIPRRMVKGVIDRAVEVDVRSFGIRTPPCTREKPTYGIVGLLHVIPPALAWLWRMVSPRGHENPSITDSKGMSSEGVGSYWPFATGRRVDQANLLIEQIINTPATRYVLTPNQHVGAWKVGFMPEWIIREYLARRSGVRFRPDQLVHAKCPLLGYALKSMQFEGTQVSHWFLQVDTQPEIGPDGYQKGAEILTDFFHRELKVYLGEKDLHPKGREVIQCCLDGGNVDDYMALIPNA